MRIIAPAFVDDEANLLKRGPAMFVGSKDIERSVMERAEQTPLCFAGRAVARVVAVPHALGDEDRIGALEDRAIGWGDPQVVGR